MEVLPSLIGPIVGQILQPALQAPMHEMLPTLVGSAVKLIGSDGGVAVKCLAPKSDSAFLTESADHNSSKYFSVGGVEPSGVDAGVESELVVLGGGGLVEEPVQRDGLQAGKLRLGSTLTEASGAVVNPKASGVDACVSSELVVGCLVCIIRLIQDPSLNGRLAKVLGFDADSGRYMVELEDGLGSKRIRRANIATEEELEGSVDSEDLVDAECVEEDESGVSGYCYHSKSIFSSLSAGGQSESLSAAPACP